MNRYGDLAMRYWQTYRPSEYATITNPTRFFTELGNQVQEQVNDLADAIVDQRGGTSTSFQANRALLTEATQEAEESVLNDLVFLPKEPGTEDRELPRSAADSAPVAATGAASPR